MEKLLAKHEAELKNLKEKRQKKKQAQLASINKRLQQQQQQGRLQQQRSDDDINDVWKPFFFDTHFFVDADDFAPLRERSGSNRTTDELHSKEMPCPTPMDKTELL